MSACDKILAIVHDAHCLGCDAVEAQGGFRFNVSQPMNLPEAVPHRESEATFMDVSVNKIDSDREPLYTEVRFEPTEDHEYFGALEAKISIDRCADSPWGISNLASGAASQDYNRCFGMRVA